MPHPSPASYLLLADRNPMRLCETVNENDDRVEYHWQWLGGSTKLFVPRNDVVVLGSVCDCTILGYKVGKNRESFQAQLDSLQLHGALKAAFDLAPGPLGQQLRLAADREYQETERQKALLAKEKEEAIRIQAESAKQMRPFFERDFTNAAKHWAEGFATQFDESVFKKIRREFVKEWFNQYSDLTLDSQQADAVAECGTHLQLVARAGSGKTRTLVARALFQIKHLRVDPRRILILAFNRKAVSEVRTRLERYLDESNRPHVLTFHALAWRIVRPSEELLYDEDESDEGKRLSQTIQEIIRKQLREGSLESDIRELMRINWEDSLARIIQKGFDLPEQEFIALRERMHDTTLDGRRVETEAHKFIGDFLLQHGLDYSYRPTIWRHSGKNFTPAFLHITAAGRRIVIEAAGRRSEDPLAAQAFWESDKVSSSVRVCLDADNLASRNHLTARLSTELKVLNVELTPLNKEALWEKIRDKVIDSFTKSVQDFISRCQKECLWPDLLANRIDAYKGASELQSKFWTLALKVFRLYELALAKHKTDFDRLMLEAAEQIASQTTVFRSASGKSDLRNLSHILIDEFQDFSLLFDRLRSAMVKVNSSALYFCVGDDWQAINRFAGSNLRYFSGFTDDFRPSQTLEITTNYRSASSIVDAGNRVMEGLGVPSTARPGAPQGTILLAKSAKDSELSPEEDAASERFGQLAVDILRLAQMSGMPLDRKSANKGGSPSDNDDRKIAVLTRTKSLPTPNGMRTLEQWEKGLKRFLRDEDRDRIEFSTVHGYKGREATTVILVEPEIYPLIHPDAVLAAIFGDTYETLVEDERRLFYVGVTRAEETLVLLQTNPDSRIDFLDVSRIQQVDVAGLTSDLLIGDEVVVSLRNTPDLRDLASAGTMPLKEILKDPSNGFIWKRKQGAWIKRFPIEELPEATAFDAYLRSRPWIGQADQIIATLTGEGFAIEFHIIKGQTQRIGATLTIPQNEEIACLPDAFRKPLRQLLEHLHLKLGLPWPEFGYEWTDINDVCDGSLLTLAWPDQKIGIALPTNEISSFIDTGWTILPAETASVEMLRSILPKDTAQPNAFQTALQPQSPMETTDEDDLPF